MRWISIGYQTYSYFNDSQLSKGTSFSVTFYPNKTQGLFKKFSNQKKRWVLGQFGA